MFGKPSLMTRIATGKLVGLCIGLLGFFIAPMLWPGMEAHLRWAILLWYTTMGAVIGVFGVCSYNPILKVTMPWWLRSAVIGGWMNFVLSLFLFPTLQGMLVGMFGADSFWSSPFWLIAEGALVGFIIDFFATRFGGEGPRVLDFLRAESPASQ